MADQFSLDFGRTWLYPTTSADFYRFRAITQPFGRISTAGITYRTQENSVPIANSTARLNIATDLLRTDASGQSQPLRLPGFYYLKGLHLDAKNRLYVAASGLRFDESTSTTMSAKSGKSAVVYISRRPLP